MSTYFISDLHLQAAHPEHIDILSRWLKEQAKHADALYILGDFFDVWIGDDDNSAFANQVKALLRLFTDSGIPTYFMRGNRDFAIGRTFAEQTGVVLLNDPTVITLYQQNVLLTHGDYLCIDDKKHQALRHKIHHTNLVNRLLKLPLFIRRLIARWARNQSRKHTRHTDLSIQDVNRAFVLEQMQKYQTNMLIHGHTHRPAIHELNDKKRIVLADWRQHGYALEVTKKWQLIEHELR